MSEHCLVLGIDASGKSTFLRELPESLGYTVIEPAESPSAREFRLHNLNLDITPQIITDRRNLFLGLNRENDTTISEILSAGGRVATTGSSLVTNVSHDLMWQRIHGQAPSVSSAVDGWIREDSPKPDLVVFLHADDSVIKERNDWRQAHDLLETQAGFYSPDFLKMYQESWFNVIQMLGEQATLKIVDYDSGKLTSSEITEHFATV